MDNFSDFDTDYYGMNRFQDIMENGGNVDLKRLQSFIKDSVNDLADLGQGTVRHIDFGNGLSVVCAWEEAPESDDDGRFVDGGYEICVSVRETDSAPRVEEWNVLSGSVALTESDENEDYREVAEALYAQIMDADPETVDSEMQDRDETIFDTLPDFKGSFDEWSKALNDDIDTETNKPFLGVDDMTLGKHMSGNGYVGDAVIFKVKTDLVDADMNVIDEYLTQLMPKSISDWIQENGYDFNFDLESKNEIAFVVW